MIGTGWLRRRIGGRVRAGIRAQWDAVDAYICDRLVPSDPALDAALAASAAAELPAINVAPNQGKLLQLLAQSLGACRILEIGTLGGYSTIWLARALEPTDTRQKGNSATIPMTRSPTITTCDL